MNCQRKKNRGREEPETGGSGKARYRPGAVDPGASAGNLLWQERHDVGAPSFSWQTAHSDMVGNPGAPFPPWQSVHAAPEAACTAWEKTTSRYVFGNRLLGGPERPYRPAFDGSAAWRWQAAQSPVDADRGLAGSGPWQGAHAPFVTVTWPSCLNVLSPWAHAITNAEESRTMGSTR
jgi:hypothetical protein